MRGRNKKKGKSNWGEKVEQISKSRQKTKLKELLKK